MFLWVTVCFLTSSVCFHHCTLGFSGKVKASENKSKYTSVWRESICKSSCLQSAKACSGHADTASLRTLSLQSTSTRPLFNSSFSRARFPLFAAQNAALASGVSFCKIGKKQDLKIEVREQGSFHVHRQQRS